jgi:hypothetical protein
MNLHWFGMACAAGAFAGFLVSYRLASKATRETRVVLALATTILAIPGASFAAYYLHILPKLSWYYEFRSWPGTEGLLIVVGLAGGLVATFLPRKLLIVPLSRKELLGRYTFTGFYMPITKGRTAPRTEAKS